jgi:hypothetical protein
VRARLVGFRCHVGDLARTLSLDSDVALGPHTSSAGVAPEAARPGAVRPGARERAWQLAQANLRGIVLGEARVASADVVTVVNDGVASWDDGARFGSLAVAVRSKADLGGEHGAALPTSAATGQELEPLRRRALAGVADPVRRGTSRHSSPRRGQQALAAAVRDHFAAAGSLRRVDQRRVP